MNTHDIDIELPPLPDIPAAICPWDHSEGVVKNLLEAYAIAAIEADRQKNNALIRYIPEVIAALKATGCNESLVADIEKSMRGERDRQESEPAYWRITKTDGVIFFECYHAAVENYRKEGWNVEPLYTAPQPTAEKL